MVVVIVIDGETGMAVVCVTCRFWSQRTPPSLSSHYKVLSLNRRIYGEHHIEVAETLEHCALIAKKLGRLV